MKVKLKFLNINRSDLELEIEGEKTFSDLLESIGINPETVIILKDKTPLPSEDKIVEGEYRVVRVISGG
ncbi:MAG: MoaD/ThiS family protein [Archaeoglobaceae archaeon]|nr:MoaD/ThiS family protein [Archaeoglobaceae archaeon]MCX8151686.1 MoaD/ThiS family protein [Archaeoglobaceae archaeon]MDW8013036.1 MoaD/ThiS family protein [Archaeoglobaceae archaeon]